MASPTLIDLSHQEQKPSKGDLGLTENWLSDQVNSQEGIRSSSTSQQQQVSVLYMSPLTDMAQSKIYSRQDQTLIQSQLKDEDENQLVELRVKQQSEQKVSSSQPDEPLDIINSHLLKKHDQDDHQKSEESIQENQENLKEPAYFDPAIIFSQPDSNFIPESR